MSAAQLAREPGVNEQNLQRWPQEVRSLPIVADRRKPGRPLERNARVLEREVIVDLISEARAHERADIAAHADDLRIHGAPRDWP